MAKISDDELKALIDSEVRTSLAYSGSRLSEMRRKAEYYYLGLAKGDLSPPEIEGRSKVVSPVVRNTIEAMMPQLMVKFCGGDKVVEFEPTRPEDEGAAKQATEYLNYLFYGRNRGHRIAYTWMKDALLHKTGILKVWWDTSSEELREEYRGLNAVELAQLADDDEVEITEQKAYPDEEREEDRQSLLSNLQQQMQGADPQTAQALQAQIAQVQAAPAQMLYDVACVRSKTGGKLRIENVPPEEFLISRRAKSIVTAPFVGHRVLRTISDLRSMGYANVDEIGSGDSDASTNMERMERMAFDDEMAWADTNGDNGDESQRQVWVLEAYIRADRDGDGISELLKVTKAGNVILDIDMVDEAPFVDICPVPLPHKFTGLSVADLAMESQRVETSLLRATLDNVYLETNGRYFAVEGQVNLDDLLMSRPGGVVRVKAPGAVGRLDQAQGNTAEAMGLMAYFKDRWTPDSVGWSPNSAGTDPNALNKTATGMQIVTNKADMRLDLIARNFADGFEQLFKQMLRLVCQHSPKEEVVKLSGQWVSVDPRLWRNQFDITINVGLGMGNKDQNIAHLMALFQAQGTAMQIGVANPENVFATLSELAKSMGFKSAEKFFTDPKTSPPPQQPNPEAQKAQAQMQLESAKMQAQAQLEQAKMQQEAQLDALRRDHEIALEKAKLEYQAMVDNNRQRAEAEQKTLEIQQQAQLDQLKAQIEQERHGKEQEFAAWKAKLDAETKVLVAKIGASKSLSEVDEVSAIAEPERRPSAVEGAILAALDGFTQAIHEMKRPKQVIRGSDGKVQGIV